MSKHLFMLEKKINKKNIYLNTIKLKVRTWFKKIKSAKFEIDKLIIFKKFIYIFYKKIEIIKF
jgi:hypothetical protein